ncbi:NfeD family protein [Salibacterium halotolerans]|uniref:NfeD-like C-terminal, partner-binding n=1 Tax=Salibacterium halotolerans TaxID=1884432 RepID=A0A1I5NJ45_9BACI|nr:NfeD family protein [Salibacterium halotolerans]SFP21757.1 NfeD-like C-terminal, partner-binding [Salibacterium halotolerans]
MDWLQLPSIGFLVVFLGTLFLMGEMLVKAKGLFAILGIALMSLFFTFHIDAGGSMWIIILYLLGVALIILDGKVISDGTIALFGALLMGLGLAVPTPSITYGVLVVFGYIAGLFSSGLFLKVFTSRNLWSKITLKDQLGSEQGYNSMDDSYRELKGKSAKTLTPFRPTGTIIVEGRHFSATSGDQWLEADEAVTIAAVDGTKILVRRREEYEADSK